MKIKQIHKNWQEVELGKISEMISRGKSPKYVEHSGIKIINQACIYWNYLRKENIKYHEETSVLREEFILKKEDILINSTGTGTLGRAIVFNEEGKFTADSHVTIFRTNKKLLNPRYFVLFLETQKGQKELYQKCVSGSTNQIELSKSKFEKLKIPLPPLETQKKIVSILEKAESLKQKREQASKLSDEYLKSVFCEMFLNKEFPRKEIGEVVIKTENIAPEKQFGERFFEYIDISSIDNLNKKIIITKKILGKEAPSRAKQQVKYKDVLISTVRPNLNAISLVPQELNDQICSTGFCILRSDPHEVLSEYLFFISKSKSFVDYLVKRCKGANYPAVSNSDVKSFKIPLPPIELQEKFASIVEHVERLKEKQKKSKEDLDEIFNSLMQKAFNGELVA